MPKYDTDVPEAISILIEKMLDEDFNNPSGTASKAASQLLDKSIKLGREGSFKEALRFWKNARSVPDEFIWQWFNGVFKTCTAKPTSKIADKKLKGKHPKAIKVSKIEDSHKHQPSGRKQTKRKG